MSAKKATQAQKVRFTAKDVDAWTKDFCHRREKYCDMPFLKSAVDRYAIELKYIAAHWQAARFYGDYGRTIREFEMETLDPENAPTKFDLMDRLYFMMYKRSLKSLQGQFKS